MCEIDNNPSYQPIFDEEWEAHLRALELEAYETE